MFESVDLAVFDREEIELSEGQVVQVIVVCGVVLSGVDEEQAKLQCNKRDGLNSWKTLKSLLDLRRQLLHSKEGLILLNDR